MPGPAMVPNIYVNGRFLGRTTSGVERFAWRVLDAVHQRLARGDLPGQRWTVLAPEGVTPTHQWPAFDFRRIGHRQGHLWEQTELARAARDGLLINLCNSGPVIGGPSLTVIHDALVYDLPQNFSARYRLVHQLLGRLLARRTRLATVSAFSRDRLAVRLKVAADRIGIIGNAADHVVVGDAATQAAIVADLGLAGAPYLLFVGSFAPNKNLPRVIEAFSAVRRADERLVLVGAPVKSFAQHGVPGVPDGVVLPGRLPDDALIALYAHARALVFPSLYEGFGIPPLEAMRLGCPVIASDIPALREVCGSAALFCNPHDAGSIGVAMRTILDDAALRARLAAAGQARAADYSWAQSADALIALINAPRAPMP